MANKPRGYGFSAEAAKKIDSKYDPTKEEEARKWIDTVLGESIFGENGGVDTVHQTLKDGQVLCRLANRLGGNLKINQQKMPFKQMENIGNFLSFIENKLGVAKNDLFQTVDLYEKSNMWNVICCIHAVGRRAYSLGKDVPQLGPKESTKNPRQFTERQLNEGKTIINSFQMGPAAKNVATASGQSFGRQRQIINDNK
ncbi:muscle-specific protein 20 isoform X1 [Nematostella vectensis]|uniref:muscle-specific protein 20 isoform X1 n=1 Tax=Nematostella vectensis TaxID=45351 RepID=UPI0020777948|nr:muscle-specific protein 20 isoform X1 [Nematostella vectensis]